MKEGSRGEERKRKRTGNGEIEKVRVAMGGEAREIREREDKNT